MELTSVPLAASPVVRAVLLILALASLVSWTLIFYQRGKLQRTWHQTHRFEQRFREQRDHRELYLALLRGEVEGLARVFVSSWQQFEKLSHEPPEVIERGVERVGRAAIEVSLWPLERWLPWLATIGSTAPYVGLFGTVWGVMESFRALAGVKQATFDLIAPGVAEALIATAFGLFVAIPATVAYNRYLSQVEMLERRYRAFLDLLIGRMLAERRERFVT